MKHLFFLYIQLNVLRYVLFIFQVIQKKIDFLYFKFIHIYCLNNSILPLLTLDLFYLQFNPLCVRIELALIDFCYYQIVLIDELYLCKEIKKIINLYFWENYYLVYFRLNLTYYMIKQFNSSFLIFLCNFQVQK